MNINIFDIIVIVGRYGLKRYEFLFVSDFVDRFLCNFVFVSFITVFLYRCDGGDRLADGPAPSGGASRSGRTVPRDDMVLCECTICVIIVPSEIFNYERLRLSD